ASAADTMAKAMAKDVAEALRRAAEADTKSRGVGRELADALRRAEQAEARATSARELETRVAELEQELAGTIARAEREDGQQIEDVQRELATHRSAAAELGDHKARLERELTDAHSQRAEIEKRAAGAGSAAEAEIEALKDRIDDLESGLAVAETAAKASV